MFALAPMLILAIAAAGLVFEAEAVRGEIFSQIRGIVGDEAAQTVEIMIQSAARTEGGALASVLGAVTVMIGATGVFTELRRALNSLSARPPTASGLSALLRVRLMGVALVLGMGFLAIASLTLSAVLSAVQALIGARLPLLSPIMSAMDIVASTLVLTLAFAALLRWLPDRPASRRGTWWGALCSSVLFTAGKSLIGLYLGTTGVSSSYGAAGSFVMIMLWVYYSAQILLFGGAVAFTSERDADAQGP